MPIFFIGQPCIKFFCKYLLFAGPTSPAEEVVDVLLEGDEGAAALVAIDWVRHSCSCCGDLVKAAEEILVVQRLEIE